MLSIFSKIFQAILACFNYIAFDWSVSAIIVKVVLVLLYFYLKYASHRLLNRIFCTILDFIFFPFRWIYYTFANKKKRPTLFHKKQKVLGPQFLQKEQENKYDLVYNQISSLGYVVQDMMFIDQRNDYLHITTHLDHVLIAPNGVFVIEEILPDGLLIERSDKVMELSFNKIERKYKDKKNGTKRTENSYIEHISMENFFKKSQTKMLAVSDYLSKKGIKVPVYAINCVSDNVFLALSTEEKIKKVIKVSELKKHILQYDKALHLSQEQMKKIFLLISENEASISKEEYFKENQMDYKRNEIKNYFVEQF